MTIYCCLTLTNSSLSAQQLEIYLNARLSEIARFSSANKVVNEELKLYWELYQVIKRGTAIPAIFAYTYHFITITILQIVQRIVLII
jgi:hypothetical protein